MLKMTLYAIVALSIILILLPHLVWLISWLIGLCLGGRVPYAPFGWTAIGLEIMMLLVMGHGIYIGRFRLQVNSEMFCSQQVPQQLDGYKIVHISDIHLSTFDDRPSALQRVVDSVNAQQPDLICFTGDLVTMGVSEALPYTVFLKQLHAKDGVYSVLGNHDFLIYRHNFASDEERTLEVNRLAQYEHDSLGWQVLRNGHSHISDALTLIGVDNKSGDGQGFHTIRAGDLSKAMEGTNGFRILLTHDPSHWRAEVADQLPIALTLSGHTHAGQVKIFGWPLSATMFRDNIGWINATQQALYINQGIGCTLPFRLNCPQEITVITLKNI